MFWNILVTTDIFLVTSWLVLGWVVTDKVVETKDKSQEEKKRQAKKRKTELENLNSIETKESRTRRKFVQDEPQALAQPA